MVNSFVELVVVSGPWVLFHLRAALVYAVDVDHRSVICLAWRNDPGIQAKTCNHCSRDRAVSEGSHVRNHPRWPSGQCLECLLHNVCSAIEPAVCVIDFFLMCQKSFQSAISISLPHAA
ncbi:hypothetical protein [Burkholderia cepacia]|uniref:Uncharacterized protein n=1 Tax=Burkholderia cepacia TaxID=292 RepID=A0A8I1DSD7_BURCE|nr:hypothetical protein [Burkholderia cepacia]MBH9686471.1 hypothetical protein [Burkholderia cepacia]MBH9701757.1 hypothetical protein [Burkholderia cepacia]MBH9717694.1 hypothetical protein [Burkholderia cepacia]MBH9737347.1 hypothetical protein [Burkholderia cepacia]MBX3763983.1 hypothetical protein [Burkholderia cepacia]